MHFLLLSSLVVSLTSAAAVSRSSHASEPFSERTSNLLARRQEANNLTWYNTYHPYEDHIQYFRDLQAAFPNNSEWTSSGTSYEGRDLYGIHLWGASGPGKPAVLFHGTVHAREWIATPVGISHIYALSMEKENKLSGEYQVVEYITHQLISGYNAGDNITQSFVDNYDFYIFPIVNPDGKHLPPHI